MKSREPLQKRGILTSSISCRIQKVSQNAYCLHVMKFTSIKQQILPEKGQNVISSLSFSCSENILSQETLFTNCRQKEFWKRYWIFAFHKNLNKILEKGIMEIFFWKWITNDFSQLFLKHNENIYFMKCPPF